MKPCLTCGQPSRGTRCEDCQPPDAGTTTERGYDHHWRKLSERARKLSPFCAECGATDDLTLDHTPDTWARKAAGKSLRLSDVGHVLCRPCNTRKGRARPTPGRPPSDQRTTSDQPRRQLRMDLN